MENDILIIGTGKLPAECAKILNRQGFSFDVIESKQEAFSTLRPTCDNLSIPYETISDNLQLKQRLESISRPTTILSVNNDHIFAESLLSKHFLNVVNFHASLLPNYRGHGTVIPSWVIFNDEKIHGATWHIVRPKVDSGPIICQTPIPVNANETAISLMMRVARCGIQLFAANTRKILCSKDTYLPEHRSVSHLYKLHDLPNNGVFDFGWNFDTADRFLRSMHSHPLNFVPEPRIQLCNQTFIIRSFKSIRSENTMETPSIVVERTNKHTRALFQTTGGTIELTMTQLPES